LAASFVVMLAVSFALAALFVVLLAPLFWDSMEWALL
jgi:hypothetical protein